MFDMNECKIEWIGRIPKEWKIDKFKYVYSIRKAKLPDELYDKKDEQMKPYMTMEYIRDELNIVPQYAKNGTFCQKKDLLLLWDGSNAGEVIYNHPEGYAPSTVAILTLEKDLYEKYATYFLMFLEEKLRENTNGMGIPHVDGKFLRNLPFLIPKIEEQKLIGDMLDNKVGKIDDILNDLNRQVEILEKYKKSLITETVTKGLNPNVEMKDSGLDWIGQIPENWEINRMQDIGQYKKGPFGSAITLEMFVEKGIDTYKVYEQKNAIQQDETLGWYYISKADFNRLKDFEIFPNDIIVSCAGTIGKCHIMPRTMEKGIINQALMKITLNKDVNNYYFLYLFEIVLERISEKYSNGSAIKNIPPFSILKKYNIPTPSLKEQQKIVEYLEKKCFEIDEIIKDKQTQIEKMEKYKKSLIYEYVTGKKRVKGAEELYV